MYGCPAARAVVDPYSEDTEEEEEAGHAKAHLVHSSVSNQSFAVFSCIHCLAKLSVEGDLIGGKNQPKTPKILKLDHHVMSVKSNPPLLMFV